MAFRNVLIAVCCVALAAPAAAGVIVVGNSDARMCYEAADSPMRAQVRDIRRCDNALRENLTRYDAAATHVNRGILYLRSGQLDRALADFDQAIAIDPDQPEAYLNKGTALIQGQHHGDALRYYTVALERSTTRPAIALYGRAIANEQLGNIRAAYNDYRRASELAPDWADPRLELTRFQVRER